MALQTFDIVQKVTLAELTALVGNSALEQGIQYEVTDKGWLLLAISNNILMPVKIIELNIDVSSGLVTLPSFITTNEVISITNVSRDIDYSTGDPMVLIFSDENGTIPNWFVDRIDFITSLLVNPITSVGLTVSGEQVLTGVTISSNSTVLISGYYQVQSEYSVSLSGTGLEGTLTVKAYHKKIH